MAVVTFNVRTWGLSAFPTNERLLLRFVPSGAGVGSAAVYPARDETVQPAADGSGSVNLAPTVRVVPPAWYTVHFEWFDRTYVDGELVWSLKGWSELPGRLHVPAAGGELIDLMGDYTASIAMIWLGHGPAPSWLPGGGIYFDVDSVEGVDLYSERAVL